jgi:hypothetical protein
MLCGIRRAEIDSNQDFYLVGDCDDEKLYACKGKGLLAQDRGLCIGGQCSIAGDPGLDYCGATNFNSKIGRKHN